MDYDFLCVCIFIFSSFLMQGFHVLKSETHAPEIVTYGFFDSITNCIERPSYTVNFALFQPVWPRNYI